MNNEEILLFRKPYGVCNGHYYCVEFLKMAHTHMANEQKWRTVMTKDVFVIVY